MHAASRLLNRDGCLPGGAPPPHVPSAVRFSGLTFWVLEWLLAWVRPVGEEVVLTAVVAR